MREARHDPVDAPWVHNSTSARLAAAGLKAFQLLKQLNDTFVAIKDNGAAVRNSGARIGYGQHGWQCELTADDRSVRQHAAGFGDDSGNAT